MSASPPGEAAETAAENVQAALRLDFDKLITSLLLCLVICALAWLSLAVLGPARVAPIWPANGLILAVMLRTPRRSWAQVLIAGFVGVVMGGMANGGGLRSTVGLAACDVLELIISARIIGRLLGETTDLSRLRDVMVCGLAAGASALVGAAGAGLVLGWLGRPNLAHALTVWTLADGLGQMIGAPLVLALSDPRRLRLAAFRPYPRTAAALLALAATVVGVFSQSRFGLPFLVFAPLLVVVFQLEVLGAALGLLLTAVLAVALTLAGHGPMMLTGGGPTDRILLLQVFLLACVVVNFPVAAVLADRRRAQEVLSLNEARLRFLSEHSRDVVIRVGLDRRIIDVSPSSRHYGYEPRELIGQLGAELNHPDDRAAVTAMIDELLADPRREVGAVRQWRARLKAGGFVWMEGALSIIRGEDGAPREFAFVLRDISEHRAAAQALARSEARYRLIAENSRDLVLQFDEAGTILYASTSARQLGYAPEELVGRDCFDFVHPDDVSRARRRMGSVAYPELGIPLDPDSEFRILAADGAYVWMEGNPSVSRGAEGQPISFTDSLRDVSARRAAQEAARETLSELARVARLLTMGEFASSVAHELNQPIAAIVTNSETSLRWLGREPPNLDEARAAIGRTLRDANRAAAVIVRTRAMLAKSPPSLAYIEINGCVEDVLSFTNTELRRNGVTVLRRLQSPSPIVKGDRIQLQQVLLNLVRNAIEAMAVDADAHRVLTVTTRAVEGEAVRVSVEDTGPGLDREAADRMFESFFTTKTGGVGLGLPISRSIIESHGGRLWALPAQPHGAVFQFTLPSAPETA